jgi:hypothetical protein
MPKRSRVTSGTRRCGVPYIMKNLVGVIAEFILPSCMIMTCLRDKNHFGIESFLLNGKDYDRYDLTRIASSVLHSELKILPSDGKEYCYV